MLNEYFSSYCVDDSTEHQRGRVGGDGQQEPINQTAGITVSGPKLSSLHSCHAAKECPEATLLCFAQGLINHKTWYFGGIKLAPFLSDS